MIVIVVKQLVKHELADDFPNLVAEFTAATRAEPGNISFDWYRSPDDPDLWVLVEVFRDDEAGKAHVESAHFKRATELLPKVLAGVPDIIHANVPGDGWAKMAEVAVDPS